MEINRTYRIDNSVRIRAEIPRTFANKVPSFLEVLDKFLSKRHETISQIVHQHTPKIDVRQHSNYLLLKCTVAWQNWYTIDIVDPYNIEPLSIPEMTLLSLECLRNIADFFCKAVTGQLHNYIWLESPFTHCIVSVPAISP